MKKIFYKLSLFYVLACANSSVLGMCSPHIFETPDEACVRSDQRACHPIKFGVEKPKREVLDYYPFVLSDLEIRKNFQFRVAKMAEKSFCNAEFTRRYVRSMLRYKMPVCSSLCLTVWAFSPKAPSVIRQFFSIYRSIVDDDMVKASFKNDGIDLHFDSLLSVQCFEAIMCHEGFRNAILSPEKTTESSEDEDNEMVNVLPLYRIFLTFCLTKSLEKVL